MISKVERGKFRFTDLDILKQEDNIVLSMEDYVQGLEDVRDIRKADRDKPLIKLELK